jgi:hypothetical protein
MFKRTDASRYWDFLEILPPAWQDHRGFLVGEPMNHRICKASGTMKPVYLAFIHRGGYYWESKEPMSVLEFRAVDVSVLK